MAAAVSGLYSTISPGVFAVEGSGGRLGAWDLTGGTEESGASGAGREVSGVAADVNPTFA